MSSQIKITVGGINYSVKSDETEEYLNELGNELERKLKYFTRQNPYLSTTMTAIMVALESCDDAKKAHMEIERLKSRIEQLGNSGNRQQKMRFQDK